MTPRTFDRETLLDLTVNMVPLGIMLFFIVVFVVVNPFPADPVGTALQMTIMVVMVASLGLLTYVSGKIISRDERRAETEELAHPTQQTTTVGSDVDRSDVDR